MLTFSNGSWPCCRCVPPCCGLGKLWAEGPSPATERAEAGKLAWMRFKGKWSGVRVRSAPAEVERFLTGCTLRTPPPALLPLSCCTSPASCFFTGCLPVGNLDLEDASRQQQQPGCPAFLWVSGPPSPGPLTVSGKRSTQGSVSRSWGARRGPGTRGLGINCIPSTCLPLGAAGPVSFY